MFESSGHKYKTFGALAIGAFIGYYVGSYRSKPKETISKNTFYLTDTHESTWNSVFSTVVDPLEKLYDELCNVPDKEMINIVVKTHGGSLLWCNKLTLLFKQRTGDVRVFIKDYAHSAGSVLALAADEIFMNRYATMSAIDPQVSTFGFISYLPLQHLSAMVKDNQGLPSYLKASSEYHRNDMEKIINAKHNVNKIMEVMYDGVVDHATLFTRDDVERLGVRISEWDGVDIPDE